MKRLLDLVDENDKLVIVCRYNNEVEMIAENIKKKNTRIIRITGATKDRHTCVKNANIAEKCVVIVNAACSEGYELPTFPIMVFYSYDFS